MADRIEVLGIASCQTCKKARAWLEARGLDHTWIDLREAPPSRARVQRWVKSLGAKALRNTSGGSYRALGPEKADWDDAAWLEAYAADPMLIKRPVLEIDGRPAAVGFKEPRWAELLGG
jgi:arsenate reductase (glutaredoxin)